jgi:hypothetical protein
MPTLLSAVLVIAGVAALVAVLEARYYTSVNRPDAEAHSPIEPAADVGPSVHISVSLGIVGVVCLAIVALVAGS